MVCKNCTKRRVGCHATCKDYKIEAELEKKKKEAKRKYCAAMSSTPGSAQTFRTSKAIKILSKGGSKGGTNKHHNNTGRAGSGAKGD